MLECKIEKIQDINDLTNFFRNSKGATLFHQKWYLDICNVKKALCIREKNELVAFMPLYNYSGLKLFQDTRCVPYSGPVLKKYSNERKMQVLHRKYLKIIIETLKELYSEISFSLSTDHTDIVTYIQYGFIPEVRYTYCISLNETNESIISCFSKARKYEYKRSNIEQIQYMRMSDTSYFDEFLFWCPSEKEVHIEKMRRLLLRGNACAFYAVDIVDGIVGGLFLAWDSKVAYSLYTFSKRNLKNYSVTTRLYIETILYAKNKLGCEIFDFEGSVLPGVEQYFQTFGGQQKIYFNLHWNKDREKLLSNDWYNYS